MDLWDSLYIAIAENEKVHSTIKIVDKPQTQNEQQYVARADSSFKRHLGDRFAFAVVVRGGELNAK